MITYTRHVIGIRRTGSGRSETFGIRGRTSLGRLNGIAVSVGRNLVRACMPGGEAVESTPPQTPAHRPLGSS